MSLLYPPPPLVTDVGGTTTVELPQPQLNHSGNNADESASSSSSSTVIVIIVIASVVIVSASLYLLLRFFSRRCHRSFRTYSVADDVVSPGQDDSHRDRSAQGVSVAHSDLIESLPLFSFGSVTGNVAGGDCAVCLSKFEPNDQLRLLPVCCHAFHAQCIDTWLVSNQTCPLCRSTVRPTDSDVLNKILSSSSAVEDGGSTSFRIEIGSISRRRAASDSGDGRRSYSVGSFEYIVDDGYEVSIESTHRRGVSDCSSVDKDLTAATQPQPPGEHLVFDVAGGRSWLREYLDRFNLSSRAVSFGSSGRFFTGSSRRSDTVVPVEDLEANRVGEEISELFRWLSGV
ncbi:E3 ubiquitin-protein ligase ATL4 [Cornus florida]|uniref:E3 ubiquitin-protein ligase ATL4 n=1 Tax=Cornus florida TaxID=4283 RepID=UPI00289E7553|nr:E3 ubiquitin-protein ligase ATL4 [Cornus florida]